MCTAVCRALSALLPRRLRAGARSFPHVSTPLTHGEARGRIIPGQRFRKVDIQPPNLFIDLVPPVLGARLAEEVSVVGVAARK